MTDPIDLVWVATSGLEDAVIARLETVLSDAERHRAGRFLRRQDQVIYTVAHALTRGLFAERTGRPARSIAFGTGEFGKPFPILTDDDPALSFNLSHTSGLVVVAIGTGAEIGVDVEWVARKTDLAVARSHFAPVEQAALEAAPMARQADVFFQIWTLKEAYIKAIGTGLSTPLKSFGFALEPPKLVHSDPEEDAARWQFQTSLLESGHRVSLALRRESDAWRQVEMRAMAVTTLLGLCAA